MAKFLLCYYGGRMPETPADQEATLAAWDTWMGTLGDRLVDGGNPTAPAARTINAAGEVTDGPTGQHVSGYTIIEANSLDEATDLAKGCPVLLGGATLTVYETIDVMAMMAAQSN